MFVLTSDCFIVVIPPQTPRPGTYRQIATFLKYLFHKTTNYACKVTGCVMLLVQGDGVPCYILVHTIRLLLHRLN